MRYSSLFLALACCLATPVYSANNATKDNKTASAPKSTSTQKRSTESESAKPKTAASSKKTERKATSIKNSDREPAKDDSTTQPRKKAANAHPAETEKKDSKKNSAKDTAATRKKETTKGSNQQGNAKNTVIKKENAPKEAVKEKTNKKNTTAKDTEPQESRKKGNSRKIAAQADSDKPEKATQSSPARSGVYNDTPELRAALSAATNDLEAKQTLQKRTADFLVRVNGDLKTLQQNRLNLSNINSQQRDAWNRLQKLDTDLSRLKTEITNTRAQISRFVSANYKNSQPNAVALFLKNAEPGQKTRFLRYTRYINVANEKVVKELAQQQKALSAQEAKVNSELRRLNTLQANAQAALKKQGAKNTPEQIESRRQNAQMAKDAKKAVAQKDNEKRLNHLINDLDTQKAEQRKKEAEQQKKAAEARLAAAEKARLAKVAAEKAAAERAAMSNLTAEDMKLQAPATVNQMAIINPNSFSRMQGRLKKPVNGILSGLFGQARNDGSIWKGVFYNTTPTSVSSIASGDVVYADNLEGYGKVVVIDHGDKYVSVYSGLSDISVEKGYSVGTGNKIGTSGTLPSGEEGLYLEIRYNGQNMNPLSWIN